MAVKTGTVIVGGGQAGLSLSAYLTSRDHAHVVLERGRVGERWRSERWDSLHMLTPNSLNRLDGAPGHADPDGFLARDAFVDYLEQYAASAGMPVRSTSTCCRWSGTAGGSACTPTTASGLRNRSSLRPGTVAFRTVLPRRRLLRQSSHSSTQPSIEGRNSSPPARCWSSAPGRAAFRSPPSCDGLVARSSSRWGDTRVACAATGVGTSFTGSSGSAIRNSRSTRCRPQRGAHPASGSAARTAASSSTWRRSRSSASRLPVG